MKPEPMSVPAVGRGPRAVSQPVDAPLTRAAIFLVATVNPGFDNRATLRSFCGDLSALLRAVEFRDLEAGLSCVVGFGSDAWDRLFGPPRPAELHPFREIRAGARHAVSTPGDLLFHIRAKRMDLCFELAMQIMARLGDAVSPVDEVHGFRYFDDRDLMGFVDGTENPRGEAVMDAVLVGDEDAAFAGGSYVIVQKYLHDLDGWNALSTEAQERIIGRTKLSDIELDDSIKPTSAHNALTTIVEDGKEIKILRDNMPFGRAARGRIRHLFHRLQPFAPYHRTDARKHVRWPAARQLRPASRFQPRRHWKPLFCSVCDISGSHGRGPARRGCCAACCRAGDGRGLSIHSAAERRFAGHWFPQRRNSA